MNEINTYLMEHGLSVIIYAGVIGIVIKLSSSWIKGWWYERFADRAVKVCFVVMGSFLAFGTVNLIFALFRLKVAADRYIEALNNI